MINAKEFKTVLLKNVRDRGMKVDKNAIDIVTEAFFEELSKIRDDHVVLFINERMFNARNKSKGD